MRAVLIGLLLGALAYAPAAAADETLQSSGTIAYSWHGDPARGCAQAGVCGVHGSLVIQPQGQADLSENGPFGAELSLESESATVRVLNGDGSSCVDQSGSSGFGLAPLTLTSKANGSVVAGIEQPLSSGRCAGPLPQDLAGIALAGRRSSARRPSFDFRRSVPFTAGPYSGTLDSTLKLVPATPPPSLLGGFGSSSGSSGSSSGPALHRALLEQVHLRYRVTVLAGGPSVSFAGESGPFCTALGSCGSSGSVTVALPGRVAGLDLFASREVGAPVGRRGTLADFRAGRLSFDGGPPVALPQGRVEERLSGADGVSCTDSVALPDQALSIGPLTPSRRAVVPATLADFSGADPLRTHCPGPGFTDVFGASQTYARTRIPVRRLLARRLLITLSSGGGFTGTGYNGTRGGAVHVELSLLKVVAKTRPEMVP